MTLDELAKVVAAASIKGDGIYLVGDPVMGLYREVARAVLLAVADHLHATVPDTYDDFGAGREYEHKEIADELRRIAGEGEK